MEVVRHQVLVIGAGCSGLRAAIEVARAEGVHSIACVSKHHALFAGAGGPGGGVAAARDDADAEQHAEETLRAGGLLCDPAVVEQVVSCAPAELRQLEAWGCPWTRDAQGRIGLRRMGGMHVARAWFVRDRTVAHVRRTLLDAALRHPAITWLPEHVVTRLLVEDGRACGVTALNLRTGLVKTLLAPVVILASGDAVGVFAESTAGSGRTGDGLALAYRAGVPLRDIEFVQFHPTGVVPDGVAVTEAVRAEGAQLLNGSRERFLEEGRWRRVGELGTRDRIARVMQQELIDGRGIESPFGPALELDLRPLDRARLARMYPVLSSLIERQRYASLSGTALVVRPFAHRVLGGVAVALDGETALPGLYAVGGVASSGAHGANGLAGNALSAALVLAARAGRAATRWARSDPELDAAPLIDQASAEAARIDALRERKGKERERAVRAALGKVMQRACGPFRDAPALRRALREIAALKARHAQVGLVDRSHIFNTELVRTLELGNLLDVAEAMVVAASERSETRGVHARTDFRKRDDVGQLRHLLVQHRPAGPVLRAESVKSAASPEPAP